MVFGGEFWVLTVTDQKCVTSGLHPFKDVTPRPGADLAVSGKISENTSHTTWKSFTNHETSTEIHLLG